MPEDNDKLVHDLRTPLAIIKEAISLLLDRIPGEINEDQAKVLTTAKNNAVRLEEMLNKMAGRKGG